MGSDELNATVSELRENMERERERSRQLEKRAAEAEYIAVWLKEELDKSTGAVDLDGTRPVRRRATQEGISEDPAEAPVTGTGTDFSFRTSEEEEMDNTRPVARRAGPPTAPLQQGPPTRPQVGTGPLGTAGALGTGAVGTVPTQPTLGYAQTDLPSRIKAESGPPTRPDVGSAVPTAPKMGIGSQGHLPSEVHSSRPPLAGGKGRSQQPQQAARRQDEEMEQLPMVARVPSYGYDEIDPNAMEDPRQMRQELLKSQRYIEEKQHELIQLEQQNLVLSEELNHEKQKVIELRRAANAEKEEKQKASENLEMNQWLQEEVTLLRNEAAKMQEKLEQATQREQFLKAELADLRTAALKANEMRNEEMGRLSMTVGDQLVQVERELAQRTRELSEATEPFLKHAHGLLGTARKACVQIEGATGRTRQAPPLYDARSRDLSTSFRCILKLLKYIVEVLAQHTGMVNPFGQGDTFSVTDTKSSLHSSFQDQSAPNSQKGIRTPSSEATGQEPGPEVAREEGPGTKSSSCPTQ